MINTEDFYNKQVTKEEIKKFKENISNYLNTYFIPNNSPKKEQFESWFDGYLKNYIFKNKIIIEKDQEFHDKLLHAVDYLNSAQAKKRFDRMTWDVLEKQLSNWDQWLKKRAEEGDDPHGTLLVRQLKDDWHAVKLISKKALSYEGGQMGHCVGSYNDKVQNGISTIFSLRDKNDKSHITIEVMNDNNTIVQIQGKENKKPIEKYQKYLFEFIAKEKIIITNHIKQQYELKQIGFEFFKEGEAYYNKIKELIASGENYQNGGLLDLNNIDLKDYYISGKWDQVIINQNTNIKGIKNLYADTITINSNSENINFENTETNNLIANNSLIGELKSIKIKNKLHLNKTPVHSIPDYNLTDFYYHGSNIDTLTSIKANAKKFTLINCQNIKELNCEKSYESIYLENTGIETLASIHSKKVQVINSPIYKIDLTQFSTALFENILIDKIENFESKEKTQVTFRNCKNLKSIQNIKMPHLSLDVSNNSRLEEVSKCSLGFINLEKTPLKKLEVIRVHSINLNQINMEELSTRRINIRKITTNDPNIIKNRKIGERNRRSFKK